MVVLTIFVSAIAGTVIISGSISHGMKEIKKELCGIKDELTTLNRWADAIDDKEGFRNGAYCDMVKKIDSLRKVLARNFRIAMNDEEFENL